MSEMAVANGTPEVFTEGGVPKVESVPAEFSGKWRDFDKDMAAIVAEQPEQPANQPPVVIPEQAAVTPAEIPVATTAQVQEAPKPVNQETQQNKPVPGVKTVEVPEKFRGPDGKLDQGKLLKSYGEAEKALHRAQNALQAPQVTQPASTVGQPVQTSPAQAGNLTPFEVQVAQDIFSGGGFTEQQAISMARVQVRLAEARLQAENAATFSKVAQFEQTLQDQARAKELESLAQDPKTNWVLTPEGQAEMVKVRQENPYHGLYLDCVQGRRLR